MENNNWWTGVVENRDDPEKLGRCKVRIFGYHIDDTNILPTKELPWAIPLQSVTSAATSGIGSTPLGIVPGTWVVGFFLDGNNAQQPVIMGTIAGKPTVNIETQDKIKQRKEENFYLKNTNNELVYDNSGNPIPKKDRITDVKDGFSPISKGTFDLLLRTISRELSNNNLKKVGTNNELGKYQIDVLSLVNLGYLLRPPGGIVNNSIVDTPSNWYGRNKIKSKEEFLNSDFVQESVMLEQMTRNYNLLVRLGKITESTPPAVAGALLGTAHIVGALNSDKLDKKAPDGKKVRNYFVLFNSALGGNDLNYITQIQEESNYLTSIDSELAAGDLNNEELSKVRGFSDPNRKYPKYEYANNTDVNKLAIGNTSHTSFKVKQNNRITNIPIARTKQTWNEPDSAFAGAYPNNQVIETEAGHVVEFDNTPNAERIHVYHKQGTYIEIDVNGSVVKKVVGDNYEIVDRNEFLYVKGAHSLTVEGKTNILVQNDAAIQVDGDLSVTGHADTLVQSAGTIAVVSRKVLVSAKESMDIVTEGSLKIQAKDIGIEATGGSVGIKSSKDIAINSGKTGTVSIKGGIAINNDAAIIRNKMGGTNIVGLGLGTLPPPDRKTIDKTSVTPLQRTIAREEYFLYDSNEDGFEDYKANSISDGNISDLVVPASTGATSRTFTNSNNIPIQTNASELDKFTTFPRSFRLSKYFTLSDMLVGNQGVALVSQGGLSEKQIVTNMKNLAVNCLDPIKEKYKDLIITSGFRSPFVGSDHNAGSAADLMFTKTNFSQYKDIAEWIAANIPYRQLLLEYRFNSVDDAPAATWIHISLLVANGKIVPSSRLSTATFKNHSVYVNNKFVNLA